jgi:hypothetical protein
MMKKIIVFTILSLLALVTFSNEIFFNADYSLTHQATSSSNQELYQGRYNFDYMGGRVSYLFSTDDTNEIKYGPYLGLFYNYKIADGSPLSIVNENIEMIGLELGLNVKYSATLFKDINFSIIAYGGVNSIDYLKTFSTEILVGAGLNYKNFYISSGYETRYYKNGKDNSYTVVNYFPIQIGVTYTF